MSNLNCIVLQGNLTQDPTMLTTKAGKEFIKLRLGVNKRFGPEKEETLYIDVLHFGNSAPSLGKYLKKGRNVTIQGRLANDDYENKEGNKVYGYSIIANEVSMGSKPKQEQEIEASTEVVTEEPSETTPF